MSRIVVALACPVAVLACAIAAASAPARGVDSTVTLSGPIAEIAADGGRAVAVVAAEGSRADTPPCADVVSWDRAAAAVKVIAHGACGDPAPVFEVAAAGRSAAWMQTIWANSFYSTVYVSGAGRGARIVEDAALGDGEGGRVARHPTGDGSLLVYDRYDVCAVQGPNGPTALVPCPTGVADGSTTESTVKMVTPASRVVARAGQRLDVLAVGGGRIAVRTTAGTVVVLAPRAARSQLRPIGGIVAERPVGAYPYALGAARAAATDGRTLVVLRSGALDVIPLSGTAGARSARRLPAAASYGPDTPFTCTFEPASTGLPCAVPALRLVDYDGGIAVYVLHGDVHLLDVVSGRDVVARRPAGSPVDARLEPDGLYVSAGRTLAFTARAEVDRRVGR